MRLRAVADRMGLHLNAAPQGLLEKGTQVLRFVGEKPGRVGVGVLLEERRAARAQRSVGIELDRPLREAATVASGSTRLRSSS